MSIKIEVSDKAAVSRQDTFRVNPNDVKDGRNSRMIAAANYDETVRARALSIAKQGQLQPAEARREDDKTLTLVSGYTRRDAVKLLREGFDAIDPDTGETTHYQDANATLWIKVVDVSEDEAFLRSIKENLERKDTTDLQEALAQQELRTTMGWTDSKIARFYGYANMNRVAALSKFLTLPKKVQEQVHSGKLALYAALDTLELSDDERNTVLDGATGENGKISGSTLRKLVRDLYEKAASTPEATPSVPSGPEPAAEPELRDAEDSVEEGDGADPKAKKYIPRGRKDVERLLGDEDAGLSTKSKELLDVLVLWLKGRRTDAYMVGTLNEYTK